MSTTAASMSAGLRDSPVPTQLTPSTSGPYHQAYTATASNAATPEWAKEAATNHNVTQCLENGAITIRPWRIGDPTRSWQVRVAGTADQQVRKVSYAAVVGFWSRAARMIAQSGLQRNKVDHLIICVTCEDQAKALSVVIDRILQIVNSTDGELVHIKRIENEPIYKYIRIAQVAQALGDQETKTEMLYRIDKMAYNGNFYRPAISDLKPVLVYISPDHRIRTRFIQSIAMAYIDKKLDWAISKQVTKMMNDDPPFAKEVTDAESAETAVRGAATTSKA